MNVGDTIELPAGTRVHLGHTRGSITLPVPVEVEVDDIDTNEYGTGIIFSLLCDVDSAVLDAATPDWKLSWGEPIPGRPGWRRDHEGREFYSSVWL